MRRKHPHWGAKRIRMQLLKAGGAAAVPAERTINRILSRHGLLDHKTRTRRRESFKRWQREAPMQLWQMGDARLGVMIVDAASGQVREAKVVTGVDDYSRYCVIAKVGARPTGRAVCLALAEALAKFGVPEEILTDNGKQFTDRFGKGGEELFDKICRLNGIAHRQRSFKPLWQVIESVNNTLKAQLDLERHGGRTIAGVAARVLQRILALTAAIWHNDQQGQPTLRSLTAYDHC